ncbi:MAG: hypothetical protein MKZ70_11945 [Opitutales bacterium]|nr:hypothetical protein [Opitutales bacterium]
MGRVTVSHQGLDFSMKQQVDYRIDSSLGLFTARDLFPNFLYVRVENLIEANQLMGQIALNEPRVSMVF